MQAALQVATFESMPLQWAMVQINMASIYSDRTSGGSVFLRYVADLSMATDLIVSNRQNQALCIQITSVSEELNQQKYEDWISTLQKWSIERGLFLSYNPRDTSFIEQLVDVLLYNSDILPVNSYLKYP